MLKMFICTAVLSLSAAESPSLISSTESSTESSTGECGEWCNLYTCGSSKCEGCQVCQAHNQGETCAEWCNVYTCGSSYCAGCDLCGKCLDWCNIFTCGLQACAACNADDSPCDQLSKGCYCHTMCNRFTCALGIGAGGLCSGCPICGGKNEGEGGSGKERTKETCMWANRFIGSKKDPYEASACDPDGGSGTTQLTFPYNPNWNEANSYDDHGGVSGWSGYYSSCSGLGPPSKSHWDDPSLYCDDSEEAFTTTYKNEKEDWAAFEFKHATPPGLPVTIRIYEQYTFGGFNNIHVSHPAEDCGEAVHPQTTVWSREAGDEDNTDCSSPGVAFNSSNIFEIKVSEQTLGGKGISSINMTMSGDNGYYEIESIAVCYLEEESLAAYLSTCSDLVSFYRVENPCCDANNDGSLMRVTPPGILAATGVPELPDCSSVWSLYVAWNCGADILLSPTGSSAGSSTVSVGINVPAGEPHPTTLVPICSEYSHPTDSPTGMPTGYPPTSVSTAMPTAVGSIERALAEEDE